MKPSNLKLSLQKPLNFSSSSISVSSSSSLSSSARSGSRTRSRRLSKARVFPHLFKLFPNHFVRRKRAKGFPKKNVTKAILISDLNPDLLELAAPKHLLRPLLLGQLHNLFFLNSLSILFFLCLTLR